MSDFTTTITIEGLQDLFEAEETFASMGYIKIDGQMLVGESAEIKFQELRERVRGSILKNRWQKKQ